MGSTTKYVVLILTIATIAIITVLTELSTTPWSKFQITFQGTRTMDSVEHQTPSNFNYTEDHIYLPNLRDVITTDPDESVQSDLADVLQKNNSAFPSAGTERYHKIYPVNCSAIFAGDKKTIESADLLLNKFRDSHGRVPVPSDDQVLQWVQNCTTFKYERRYPWRPYSKEEADYPIAYSIVVYQNSAQVERLLRAIYQPQNVYCIHIDKSSAANFHQAIRKLADCFANVFIASKLEDVKWGSFEALLADLHCMEDLLYHSVPWKYVLNLCGMDFPMKTNLEIIRQLKAYNNHNCAEGSNKPEDLLLPRFKNCKGQPPHNIILYKGNTYIAGTREFVNFFLNHKVAKDYLQWLRDAIIPDEYFTNSLNRLPYAPGGNAQPVCNLRYIHWTWTRSKAATCIGKIIRGVCIFKTGYLNKFYRSRRLFVNKFHYDFDPIPMQCLEELLNFRTLHPEEFDQWVNFPVTNFTWQQN